MNRFVDRRIIVTGGGSGIGQGTVKRLLDEGGIVHAIDVNEAGLEATAKAAAAALITPTESLSDASVRPEIVTAAPSAASRTAHARPMPVPPPVTRIADPSRPPEGDVWGVLFAELFAVMASDGSPRHRSSMIRRVMPT